MKLHILSDLHLAQGDLARPPTDADVVVLAGDIARPAEAVAWAASLEKPVLYVPGNHEFYGGSIEGTLAMLRRLCAGTNVRLLDDDEVVLGSVRILGTTLWTDFALDGTAWRTVAMREGQRFMHDFSRIRTGDNSPALFTPEDAAARFDVHRAFLSRKLDEPFGGPTVVITHHAPSRRSIHPRFDGSLLNACFVSDVEALMGAARARLWIHGHTHDSFDYLVKGTRVVCNPRGYARHGVDENVRFDPRFIVEVA